MDTMDGVINSEEQRAARDELIFGESQEWKEETASSNTTVSLETAQTAANIGYLGGSTPTIAPEALVEEVAEMVAEYDDVEVVFWVSVNNQMDVEESVELTNLAFRAPDLPTRLVFEATRAYGVEPGAEFDHEVIQTEKPVVVEEISFPL